MPVEMPARSRLGSSHPASPAARRWVLAWLGSPCLAIINGAARELTYKDRVGESAAHQISVAPLIALLALYFRFLQRRWPLPTTRAAVSVGATWVALSVIFEFGFGHYVEDESWSELRENYDVSAGNLWILILLWIAAGPLTTRAMVRGRGRVKPGRRAWLAGGAALTPR